MKPSYTEYERWEPVITELPPRSRLFPLVPVGIGTGQAESLTSYIMRLAEAHCLYVTTLYSQLLHPAARAEAENQGLERSRIALKGAHGITHSGHSWNGVSGVASCHVRALERLTGATQLHLLTWLPWKAALSHHLRQHRAWCPMCFAQWRSEGQTTYEPLLWTLQVVKICPIHHCSLVEVCPCCQRENKLLSNHARAGYCSGCKQRLNDSGEDRSPAKYQTENDGLKEQLRIAESAAEMIARAPDLPCLPSKALITQNLGDLIKHLGGNCKAFGEAIGRHHTIVVSWRDGRYIPRLETLMEICHRLHLPIVDFLTVPLEMRDDQSAMKELFFQNLNSRNGGKPGPREVPGRSALVLAPTIRSLPKKNKDRRIRQLLERELDEEHPRSVEALATEAGYKSSTMICKNYPGLVRAIITKRKEYKREWQERGRRVLADAMMEVPIPAMKEIAARVGITTAEELYRRFPNECRALSQRRAQLRKSRRVEMETNLRAALSDEPPRPLRHVAASYGYGLCEIYENHHEVCLEISARYAAYRKEETPKRRLALKERIRQIVVDLQRGGNDPSADQIKPLASDLRLSAIKRVLREIEGERPEK
ncbi:MAG: TniQ family protein [Acidobacteria bacterium]|nr:TniQ family protein [Acidobacteriota bacterium]